MSKKAQHISAEIDKLTNSIENATTGDSFNTLVVILQNKDLKTVAKSKGWLFDWKSEFMKHDRDVYKLTIDNNIDIVQGLISISEKTDHIYINLIESSPFNIGKNKVYLGVPGNLFAFACRLSFHRGFEGYVSFTSKSNLVKHYEETLGAKVIGGNLMVIDSVNASKLMNKYFNNK